MAWYYCIGWNDDHSCQWSDPLSLTYDIERADGRIDTSLKHKYMHELLPYGQDTYVTSQAVLSHAPQNKFATIGELLRQTDLLDALQSTL